MFNRLSQSLIKMNEQDQLEMLRKMVEGKLDFETVMRADALNATHQALMHGDQIGNLGQTINAFVQRTAGLLGNDAGMDIVERFKALPIRQRFEQVKSCTEQLERGGHRTEHALKQLMKCINTDFAIHLACNELVEILANKLYCISDIPTVEQCEILTNLSKNPACVIKSTNADAMKAVDSFQLLYDCLTHSYTTKDVREFIQTDVCSFLNHEVRLRTCLNKSIMTLIAVKATLDKEYPQNMGCSIFNKSKYENARSVSGMIAGLLKDPINMLAIDRADKTDHICMLFANVYEIIASEKSGLLTKRSCWDDLLDLMNGAIRQENTMLRIASNALVAAKKK